MLFLKAEDKKKRKADESSTSELSDSKVAKTEEKPEDKVETKAATKTFGDSTASKFVFGQKLSERAKVIFWLCFLLMLFKLTIFSCCNTCKI